jgi:hypothetical protein
MRMRQLPVFPAFAHAVKSAWHNLPFAFRASLPWLVVLVPINVWADLNVPAFDPKTIKPEEMMALQTAMLRVYVAAAISFVIYASIAVTWHRYVLKDEVPTRASLLRLDKTVWRYFGNSILVALMISVLLLPLALLLSGFAVAAGGFSPALLSLYMVAFVLVAVPVAYRLSVKLPAIALGREDFRFRDAWAATQGNMLRLMLLGVLSLVFVLGVGVVTGMAEELLTRVGGDLVRGAFLVLRQFVSWAIALFGITLLTSLYGFFVEGREF